MASLSGFGVRALLTERPDKVSEFPAAVAWLQSVPKGPRAGCLVSRVIALTCQSLLRGDDVR